MSRCRYYLWPVRGSGFSPQTVSRARAPMASPARGWGPGHAGRRGQRRRTSVFPARAGVPVVRWDPCRL